MCTLLGPKRQSWPTFWPRGSRLREHPVVPKHSIGPGVAVEIADARTGVAAALPTPGRSRHGPKPLGAVQSSEASGGVNDSVA